MCAMPTSIRATRKAASSTLRRPRGTPVVGIQVDLAEDAKDLLDGYTRATGLPQWAIIEAALRAGRPGSHGYPEDWDLVPTNRPVPFDWAASEEEAPIRKTA